MQLLKNKKDISDLKKAVALLESESLTMKIVGLVGKPIEWAVEKLPKGASDKIQRAIHLALDKSVSTALSTMSRNKSKESSDKTHIGIIAFSGAIGGFFGFAGTLMELPISTTIIMRSVADIARSEGFDTSDPMVKAECIQVFAMSGPSDADDATKSAYYGLRSAMTIIATEVGFNLVDIAAKQAAAVAAAGSAKMHDSFVAKETAKYLARMIEVVANRFGIQITEKIAAQSVPIIGSISGAAINSLFINHFQDMAHGHFTILRLEKIYGKEIVNKQYLEIKNN